MREISKLGSICTRNLALARAVAQVSCGQLGVLLEWEEQRAAVLEGEGRHVRRRDARRVRHQQRSGDRLESRPRRLDSLGHDHSLLLWPDSELVEQPAGRVVAAHAGQCQGHTAFRD